MKKFIYILFAFFLVNMSFAQSKRQLEARRQKLNKDIKKIENILTQTRKEKVNALDELKEFNDKVELRQKLIETIEQETDTLTKQIKLNEYTIGKNSKELDILKVDYSKMLYKLYKSKSKQSRALFLMSSKDFNQALKRLKYLNSITLFQKNQALSILHKTKLVESLNDSLTKTKEENLMLVKNGDEEKKKIKEEKEKRQKIIAKIKRDERKFLRQLKSKEKAQRRIDNKIKNIISRAIRKSNKKKNSSSKSLVLTAEEVTLKESFEQNRGKLPNPLSNGYVTRKFGVQRHPTFRRVKINSTGIHIRCKAGSDAKSVFSGKVLVVQLLSKGRKSVFVQHGNYITAYTNLESVYVKKDQKIKTGQKLGRVFTDKVTGKTTLQFVLSKNTKRLNPQSWLRI